MFIDIIYIHIYNETPLIRTLLGQKKVSWLGRCPYFRVEKYTKHMVLGEEESVLFREVSLFQVSL